MMKSIHSRRRKIVKYMSTYENKPKSNDQSESIQIIDFIKETNNNHKNNKKNITDTTSLVASMMNFDLNK